MADDEERTFSDGEAEAIEAAIEDDDEDVGYRNRPRRVMKTWMITREQERCARDDGREGRPRIERCARDDGHGRGSRLEEGMSWLDYHRVFEEQSRAGARAVERLARPAASTSDELDIYPAPRPLLVEGHRHSLYADRLGPVTREWETAGHGADESRATGQDTAAGPRRGRDESHRSNLKF